MIDYYDLNRFIWDYWNAFNYENVQIKVRLSDAVSKRLTMLQTRYLRRIFGNLRSNALKAIWCVDQEEEYYDNKGQFSNIAGRITVTTRRVGNLIEIAVSDNGHGIPEEHIEDVLKGTWSKRTRPVNRTVRGIHLIHDALSKLGGLIKLESEYGKGTTFYLYLPA